tara:strand:+ start:8292 stop:9407 length:1116 start_codon:yes stop_codon:yes gene_type:complete
MIAIKINSVLKIFKNIFEVCYSKLIIIELICRQKVFKQKFLFKLGGYGDFMLFIAFCEKYFKNDAFLSLGSIQKKILNIRVKKNKIINIFFEIPNWRVYYKIFFNVVSSKYIKKTEYDVRKLLSIQNTLKIRNIILQNINSSGETEKLINQTSLRTKKYVCFFVKQLTDKKFNWFSCFGQDDKVNNSSEKEKIIKILDFLIKQNINILILGEDRETGIDFIYKKIKNKQKYKNKIFFIKDFIKADDIDNKIVLYNNSLGYIGNGSGHAEYFYFLRKKTLIFDYLETIRPDYENERILKHLYLRKYLFKKIINKKNSKILPMKVLYKVTRNLVIFRNNPKLESVSKYYKKKYKIITNDIKEIKNEIKKITKH